MPRVYYKLSAENETLLKRLWNDNKTADPKEIAAKFQKISGRMINMTSVLKHKP